MTPVRGIQTCYAWLARHRKRMYLLCLALLVLCGAIMFKLQVRDDVGIMLPDSGSLQRSLALMDMTPFARTVFIELQASSDAGGGEALLAVAKTVAARLQPPHFSPVLPDSQTIPAPGKLMRLLPALVDADDMAALKARVTPEAMAQRMAGNYTTLLGMNGMLAKRFIQADPLGFLEILLAKWNRLQVFGGAQVRDGFLLKPDGRSLLMMLKTDVSVTDAGQSETLMKEVDAALQSLPVGMDATVLSGHRYALANAGTIKSDLRRVFAASGLGLLLIFMVFIRSRDVLWMALLPGAVLVIAGAVLAGCYDAVSGITLGFGAVLLGITVDFALHVWFALRHADGSPGQAVARVARPVLYGAATSMGAFAALLTSDISGIRQLAVFALVGLISGLALALLVLPHLVRPAVVRSSAPLQAGACRWNLPLAALVIAVLGLGIWAGSGVGIDRQLRSVGMFPEELQQAEQRIRRNWGGARDSAVLFAEGATLDQALERNHQLAEVLAKQLPHSGVVSLDPLWPPPEVQRVNRERWARFIAKHGSAIASELPVAAAGYGFSAQAFAPFLRFLSESPALLDADIFDRAGVAGLNGLLHVAHDARQYVLTLLPDTPEVQRMAASGALPQGVILVSNQALGRMLGRGISKDFILFICVACSCMFLLLLLFFRRMEFTLLAMVPLLSGIVAVLVLMRLSGGSFNLFNVVALPLVIGLGADYGIFMVCKLRSGADLGTSRAVLVSGLTTVAGFGALVLARHPGLHTLGCTVLVGVGMAIPVALLLLPALYRRTT
ncbi:exporter, putative [Syntrophotalea carbinolica DSM 2380]|uniref:Exporter, putative n=1 Tax=Syntrophotalea carbinolica (strain DSM 2380 / NBRC 103641 / GraBd1) TaxID=338963 RepID=Q3A164_SYNC1|nr:MMPL family transporter [Syntrophotalea carbinolica]ABA89893.1 exporter, putative [Syntrophotalea carbinolica DSM 2380]